MSLLPDSIRKLCDKCTLFSNRCAGVCWSVPAAALRGAVVAVCVPPTLSGVNCRRDRSRGQGVDGGVVAHLRSAEGVGRL